LPEVCVLNLGQAGWETGDWTLNDTAADPLAMISHWDADLTFFDLGLNDSSAGLSLDDVVLPNLQTLITTQITAAGAGSAILAIPTPADTSLTINLPASWVTAFADLARTNDIACIDNNSRFVSRAADTTIYSDQVHLESVGSFMKASPMFDLLVS
jgi:hypothetical protein